MSDPSTGVFHSGGYSRFCLDGKEVSPEVLVKALQERAETYRQGALELVDKLVDDAIALQDFHTAAEYREWRKRFQE